MCTIPYPVSREIPTIISGLALQSRLTKNLIVCAQRAQSHPMTIKKHRAKSGGVRLPAHQEEWITGIEARTRGIKNRSSIIAEAVEMLIVAVEEMGEWPTLQVPQAPGRGKALDQSAQQTG